MTEVKRNCKLLLVCLLVLFWIMTLTACQPTPESIVVQNKADDDLQEAILSTPSPNDEHINESSLQQKIDYIDISETFTNGKGDICINADFTLEQKNYSKIPISKAEHYNLDEEQAQDIAYAFFGNATYYDPNVRTKSEIEEAIIKVKKNATDMNSDMADASGARTLEELQEIANKRLEKLFELRETAPDEKPEFVNFDITSEGEFSSDIEIGKGHKGSIYYRSDSHASHTQLYCTDNDIKYGTLRMSNPHTTTKVDIEDKDMTFLLAKESALELIDAMNINSIALNDAYLSLDFAGYEENLSDRKYYIFCFGRKIDEIVVDYTFHTCGRPESMYDAPKIYEKIEVWVDSETAKVTQFLWLSPMRIKEVINDNVTIQVDINEALTYMSKHLFAQYADLWDGDADEMKIDITDAELAFTRIKERNSSDYLIVPAWKFYGEVKMKVREDYQDLKYMNVDESGYASQFENQLCDYKNIVTVNALDGSIINMESGY